MPHFPISKRRGRTCCCSPALLTAFGSAWYHAQPSDATLLWDRLPMALGFAGLVAGTVVYWHVSGNLMPYLVMQVGFIASALIATAFMPSRYTHANRVYAAAGLYVIAVIFERLDHQVYALLGGWISGHTLKHLVACTAIAIVYSMLRKRHAQPLFPHYNCV